MFISLILFILLLFLVVHCDDYTCSESATLRTVATQCSAVTWSVARIINHNLTNESDYYPVVLDFDEQEKRVSVSVFMFWFQLESLSLLSRKSYNVNSM